MTGTTTLPTTQTTKFPRNQEFKAPRPPAPQPRTPRDAHMTLSLNADKAANPVSNATGPQDATHRMQFQMALRASDRPHSPTGRLIEKRAAPKRDVGRRENRSAVFQTAFNQTQKQTQTTHLTNNRRNEKKNNEHKERMRRKRNFDKHKVMHKIWQREI